MKPLVVVDVQLDYAGSWHKTPELMEYINNYKGPVFFLFNGEEHGLSAFDDSEHHLFLIDNGLNPELLSEANIFDKGYGYYRDWMDMGIDDDHIIGFLETMDRLGLSSSDEVAYSDLPAGLMSEEEFQACNDTGCIHNADLLSTYMLNSLNEEGILVCGGSANECLKEFELNMRLKGVKTERLDEFVYDGNYGLFKSQRNEYGTRKGVPYDFI